LVLNHRTEKY